MTASESPFVRGWTRLRRRGPRPGVGDLTCEGSTEAARCVVEGPLERAVALCDALPECGTIVWWPSRETADPNGPGAASVLKRIRLSARDLVTSSASHTYLRIPDTPDTPPIPAQ